MAKPRRRVRTVGSVLVNPRRRRVRRRKTHARRRRNSTKRRVVSRRRRSNPKRRRSSRKRRVYARRRSNPRKRRVSRRRKVYARRRRSNPKRRRSARRSRRSSRRKVYARRRRNPVSYRKRRFNPKHRRKSRRRHARRNPAFVGAISQSLKKIPLVGGLLGGIAAVGFHGFLGGLSVEPTLRAGAWLSMQSWTPEWLKQSEWVFYGVTGSVLGGACAWLGPKFAGRLMTADGWQRLGVAVSAAGWGAGYALMRERQMANALGLPSTGEQLAEQAGATTPTEGLGALTMATGGSFGAIGVSAFGDAPAYSVGPQGNFGPGGFGAVTVLGA